MRIGNIDFRPGLVPSLVTIVLLPLLVSLAFWQLDRAGHKDRLRSSFEARRAAPAVDLGSVSAGLAVLEYRSARVRGEFDVAHQYLLDNRTRNGQAGYHVYTPLRLQTGDGAILVNRGWLPVGASRESLPALPAPVGSLTVEGVIAPIGAPPPVLGPAGYDSSDWPRVVQRLEMETIARQIGSPLRSHALVLAAGSPAAFTRDWRPYYGMSPQRHRAYAFQWFMLAGTLLVIYLVVNAKRINDHAD